MKKRLMMAMMLIASAFAFTACGDDEKTDNGNGNGNGNGTGIQSSIKETENALILTATMPQMYTMTITANFREDVCVSAEGVIACNSTAIAEALWEDLLSDSDEEELALYSRDGNNIIMNLTDEFEGASKAEVRMVFQYMIQGMNGGNPFAKIRRIAA